MRSNIALALLFPVLLAISADAASNMPRRAAVHKVKRGCTEGAISCTSETQWAVCSNGNLVNMGSTAAGTICVNGAIIAGTPGTINTSTVIVSPTTTKPPTQTTQPPTNTPPPTNSKAQFVVYGDHWLPWDSSVGGGLPPSVAYLKNQGWNNYVMAFWTSARGPLDEDAQWAQLTDAQRASFKKTYSDAGIRLLVSAFGSTETPTSSGTNAVQAAQSLAKFVKDMRLDGADIDWEDFGAVSDTGVKWLVDFTRELRNQLPSPYIITHAPVAPWFGTASINIYTRVHQQVGNLIDWYNVQFYNQLGIYQDCNSQLFSSGGQFPGTSLFEINSNSGVPLNKLVMGKPANPSDANSGYIDPATLGGCVKQAVAKNWKAGISIWQDPAPSGWLQTVRAGVL